MKKLSFVCGVLWTVVLAVPAQAVDRNGRYANIGVGLLNCAEYTRAYEAKNDRFINFGGWIDGYLSAVNFFEEKTFNILSWQSTDLLALSLNRFCGKNPKLQFAKAVQLVIRDIAPQRLPVATRPILIEDRVDGQNVRMIFYEETIRRMQRELARREFYKGDITGKFDDATRSAMSDFQTMQKRRPTGLPDQPTLLLLFTGESD